KLLTSEGDVVDILTKINIPILQKAVEAQSVIYYNNEPKKEKETERVEEINNTLVASPVLSGNSEAGGGSSSLFITSFFVFLTMSAGMVYFIRSQRDDFVAGDDFEILDE